MARITRRLAIGGGRTEPIHILGGLLHFSTSLGHRRHHLRLDKVSRHNLGKAADGLSPKKPGSAVLLEVDLRGTADTASR